MRSGAARALAFLLVCGCKAEDQVLTPDDEVGGRDAAVPMDGGSNPIVVNDAGGGTDAAQGGNPSSDAMANGADAASGDAAPSEGDAAGAPDASSMAGHAKDPDCDLGGVWIARQVTDSVAFAVLSQFASNWYYLEFAQDGEQVVVSRHMDCGMEVNGSAQVQLAEPTTRALMSRNVQTGRKGTFAKQSDGTCAFSMEKFWSVRGVNEAKYAPNPRNREATIQQLQAENPLPNDGNAAEDWDGDGKPGIAFRVANLGARHSAQRDWTRWFTAPGYQVRATTDFQTDLVVRAEFSNEETIYEADDALLNATSQPNGSAAHTLTLHFLGRTRDDPRARAFLKADDFQTCLAIQAALPAAKKL